MPRVRTTSALVTTLAAAGLLLATPGTAQAAKPAANIVKTPATVQVAKSLEHINVRVTYRCKNTNRVRYYLDGQISQYDVPETYYSIGYRNVSGTVTAICTGGRVTQTLRFGRSWWWGEPETQPRLHDGPAQFRFRLDARAATGPGWYKNENPDSVAEHDVKLVTP